MNSLLHNPLDFQQPQGRRLWKTIWKNEKMLVTSTFFIFSTVFSTLSRREIIILRTSILSSAYAFNLDHAKILLFGIEFPYPWSTQAVPGLYDLRKEGF